MDLLRVALATCAEVPEGDDEAPALTEALVQRGVESVPAVWNDPIVDWGTFDLVIIRSTWDYPARREQFLEWAESLPYVLNAPEVLRWNTDKRYLERLRGTAVPTTFLDPGSSFQVPSSSFVVKPSVGAGSIGAARYAGGDSRAEQHVAELHAAGKTVMVQPFVEAVDTDGELALIFVGGRYSHAVRKEALLAEGSGPATGLYLEETMNATQASRRELEIAEAALDAIPFPQEDLLYARVDLLPGPVVLEIELTEPSLFIGYEPEAPGRFADAITAASQRRRMSAENGPIASQ